MGSVGFAVVGVIMKKSAYILSIVIMISLLTIIFWIELLVSTCGILNDIFNNHTIIKNIILFIYYAFPLLILILDNHYIARSGPKKVVLSNIVVGGSLAVLTLLLVMILPSDFDSAVNGVFAVIYCAWILLGCILLSLYYLIRYRKASNK